MNKDLKFILYSFTRQQGADDCGAACLKMIFKFAGLDQHLPASCSNQALSMRQLQELSAQAGLTSRAVKMDLEYLHTMQSPSILHVMNDDHTSHYMLHYYFDPVLRLHLVGDPDKQVCYITDTELSQRWQSRAALVFAGLQQKKSWSHRFYLWSDLFQFDFIPGILWFAIPLLNAFGTLLGLGATLIIEKAVTQQFLNGGTGILIIIFTLLFSLSAAKCLVNFLKERMIINFAGKLDAVLYREFTASMGTTIFNGRVLTRRFTETIKDVQRVHQSASILIGGILCDGVIILVMLLGLYFYFPALVAPEAAVILVLLLLTDRQLPFMLINYQSAHHAIIPASTQIPGNPPEVEQLIGSGIAANAVYSRISLKLSVNANKLNLYFDALSSVNIILVLAYTIGQLRSGAASYQEFIFGIILCYGIVATATKICNQLFLVAQGAQMLRRHIRNS